MKTVKFDSLFQEELQDIKFVLGFLSSAYGQGGIPVFLSALKKVIQANQGMKKAETDADVARESLYRSLSEDGNPQIETVDNLLRSLGVRLEFVPTSTNSLPHSVSKEEL